MATVAITLNGVLYPKTKTADDQPIPVTFVGEAWYTGLGVGGGPILPPSGGAPVFPAHPIVPPGGYPPEGGQPPHIEHPIVLPPEQPPELPPGTPPNSVVKEAPIRGWGYYTDSTSALYAAYRTEKQPKGNP
jgi:hypothetical protein